MHEPSASAEIVRRDTLFGDAVAILGVHVPDSGWCAGCLEQWDRLIPMRLAPSRAVTLSAGAMGEPVRCNEDAS